MSTFFGDFYHTAFRQNSLFRLDFHGFKIQVVGRNEKKFDIREARACRNVVFSVDMTEIASPHAVPAKGVAPFLHTRNPRKPAESEETPKSPFLSPRTRAASRRAPAQARLLSSAPDLSYHDFPRISPFDRRRLFIRIPTPARHRE